MGCGLSVFGPFLFSPVPSLFRFLYHDDLLIPGKYPISAHFLNSILDIFIFFIIPLDLPVFIHLFLILVMLLSLLSLSNISAASILIFNGKILLHTIAFKLFFIISLFLYKFRLFISFLIHRFIFFSSLFLVPPSSFIPFFLAFLSLGFLFLILILILILCFLSFSFFSFFSPPLPFGRLGFGPYWFARLPALAFLFPPLFSFPFLLSFSLSFLFALSSSFRALLVCRLFFSAFWCWPCVPVPR